MSQETLLSELQTAAQNKQYAVLAQLAEQYMEQFPIDAAGYYYAALSAARRADNEDAKDLLDKVLALDANHTDALFALAGVYMSEGDGKAAGDIYKRLAQLPEVAESADIQIGLAAFHLRYGEIEDAFAAANAALALGKDYAPAHTQLARIYEAQSEFEQAVAAVDAALAADANYEEALKLKIGLSLNAESYAAALPAFEKLIELHPRDYYLRGDYADTLAKAAEYAEAENQLNSVLQYDPANVDYLLLRAHARTQLGKTEEALEDCRSAQLYDEGNTNIYLQMARAFQAQYDVEEAIDTLSQAIENSALPSAELYLERGKIYMEQYDFIAAEADFQLVAQDFQLKAEGYVLLGKSYMEQGNLEEAYGAWLLAEEALSAEAGELIEAHCQAQVAADVENTAARLVYDYEEFATANAESAFVQSIAGKYWRFDQTNTQKRNPDVFKELPEDMAKEILSAFTKMLFFLAPNGIVLLNPGQDDFRAVYKIALDGKDKAQLEVQPLTGISPRTFKMRTFAGGKGLGLDGFAEEMEFEIILVPADTLNNNEKAAIGESAKKGTLDFLGDKAVK